MFRNAIVGPFVALALGLMVYPGCSSSGGEGGGGAGGAQALSFDGESSVPATGGAVVAVDYSTGFARVISSMLGALAVDAGPPSSSASPKLLVDEELPICDDGGDAIFNGDFEEGTATLALTNCTGSPLSGGAVNGRLLLTFEWTPGLVPGTTNFLHALEGTAELAALTDAEGDVFTIAPSTQLTGGSAMSAEVVTTASVTLELISAQITLGQLGNLDRITVVEGAGAPMVLSCFEVSLGLTVDPPPPSITNFQAQGVVSLEGQYYTLSSRNIGFPVSSEGPAVPSKGSLTLTSGESGNCVEGDHRGDGSTATATFTSDGNVGIVAEGSDGKRFECIEDWDDLLNTLRDLTAFDSCDCVENCGTGGTGGDYLLVVSECTGDGLRGFMSFLETLDGLLRYVDDVPDHDVYDLPQNVTYNETTHQFAWTLDVDGNGSTETDVEGELQEKGGDLSNGIGGGEIVHADWDWLTDAVSTGGGKLAINGLDDDTIRVTPLEEPFYTGRVACSFRVTNIGYHLDLADPGSERFAFAGIGFWVDAGFSYKLEEAWATFTATTVEIKGLRGQDEFSFTLDADTYELVE